ncbi:MAG TPA: very short patch repair endonuclease [Solirubrobacterales bacterium]
MSPARGTPAASSAESLRRMRSQRQRDTAPEIALRSELHRRGLRYFVDRQPLPTLRRRADIVFPARRIAVFVDGCYWHGCPVHGTTPRSNGEWWKAKLAANRTRDRETDRRLEEAGWEVIRVWEHEDSVEAADRVAVALGRCPQSKPAPGA